MIFSSARRASIRLAAGISLVQAATLAFAPHVAAQAQDTLLHAIASPATGAQSNAQLGFSVAVDGNLVAVGAPQDDIGATNSGVVKVFDRTTGQLLHLIPNPSPAENDFFGISVALSGTKLVVGASQDDTGASDAGSAYVFDLGSGTPTIPVAVLNNPGPAIADQFGRSVSISGMKIVVGTYQDDTGASNAGSAYVYDLESGTPTVPVATLNNPDAAANDYFGWSVAISGTQVVVGARSDDAGATTDVGRAYVYDIAGGTPTMPAFTLSHPSPDAGDEFGYSVAISGTRVVVGVRGDDTGAINSGNAFVFDLASGTPTTPVATLNNPSPATIPSFGYSVAISGTRVAVSAPYDTSGGAQNGLACVYDLSGATPEVPLAFFNSPTATSGNWYGRSIAVSGTQVVVGAPNEDSGATDSGSAYVYDFSSGTPTLPSATLNNPGPASANLFGYSVSISGTRMVVGAPSDDTGALNAGRAYVYDLAGESPDTPVVTFNNPETAANDLFGFSVAISGGKVVIGAPNQDTGASNAGRVYVYDIDGPTPDVPDYTLNNPSPSSNASFGCSVAVSGSRVLVGAYLDDTGAVDAGSAYVYDLSSGTPTVPAWVLNNPDPAAQDYFGFSVGISGTNVVIGAYLDDSVASDSGSAYIYDLTSGTPTVPVTILNNPASAAGDWFGYAVGISDNQVVIGSPSNDTGASNAGRAYVFNLSSATPASPIATLNNPTPVASDSFGWAVAISPSRVLIGTPGQDTGVSNSGDAYAYDLGSGTPTVPVATLNNPYPAASDEFGSSVALYGKTCVVGAAKDDSTLADTGAAYVYGPAAQIIVEQPAGSPLPENGSSIDQGEVIVGNSSGSLNFTIRNNGTSNLTGISVALGGTDAGDFVLNTTSTSSSLEPGSFTSFSVQFHPTAVGARAASLSITSGNGDVNPFVIALSGTGVIPAISVAASPESVTEDGATNLEYTFTRSGPIDGPLTISFEVSGTASPSSDYTQSGADSFSSTNGTVTFAAGSSTAAVTLDPTADSMLEADETAILTVTAGSGYGIASPGSATGTITNDDTADQIAVEQPEGNALTSGSSTVDYGSYFLGTPVSRTFVIRNQGTLPISGLSVSILGTHSADFIATSPSDSLAVGANTSFTVTFTPSAAGVRSATLRITSDNIGDTPFEVTLAGTGYTARDLFDNYAALAGLSGPNADPGAMPFNDGVTNLLKYASNMNASGPDVRTLVPGTGTAGLPVLLYLNNPSPTVHYEFLRRKNSGLTYTPMQSTNLAADSWEPMTGTTTVSGIDTNWERVIIEQPVSAAGRFFRMQVIME